jgi:predicted Rossmann-fold nucleotide-binding protein
MESGNISEENLQLVQMVDAADEVVDLINAFYSQYILSPNF